MPSGTSSGCPHHGLGVPSLKNQGQLLECKFSRPTASRRLLQPLSHRYQKISGQGPRSSKRLESQRRKEVLGREVAMLLHLQSFGSRDGVLGIGLRASTSEGAGVSTTVPSQIRASPLSNGIKVTPSGLLPSPLRMPGRSLKLGICALQSARLKVSLIWE